MPTKLPALLLFGCSACTAGRAVDSTELRTSGIVAQLSVVADGTGQTTVSAALRAYDANLGQVYLNTADTLVASVDATSQPMPESDLPDVISYETRFLGHDAGGTAYNIAFHRAYDVGAPSTTCTLPQPFTLTSPAAGSLSRASDDIVIDVEGAGGNAEDITYAIAGDCLSGATTGTLHGDGSSTVIPKGTLAPGDPTQSSCVATLTLTREAPGRLDPAFDGGSVRAQQTRSISFVSTP